MREIDRIGEQLRRAVEGGAWHGPAVLELLEGVDARMAAARPVAGAHSIWEVLNHITAWTGAVERRLGGQPTDLAGEQNWPPMADVSDEAWRQAIERFRTAHQDLLKKLKSMSNDELGLPAAGQKYSNCFMLYGVIQHHLYHAGQIALLKKAA